MGEPHKAKGHSPNNTSGKEEKWEEEEEEEEWESLHENSASLREPPPNDFYRKLRNPSLREPAPASISLSGATLPQTSRKQQPPRAPASLCRAMINSTTKATNF